jgi:hypothetical protein
VQVIACNRIKLPDQRDVHSNRNRDSGWRHHDHGHRRG